MGYTIGEAAKATGKTKSTISKAIKSGRISAIKSEGGKYNIDPAELHRVYPPVSVNGLPRVESERRETPNNLIDLKVEVRLLNEQLAKQDETVKDLRRRLDMETEERQKVSAQLTGLLTDQRAGFWRRLFGGAGGVI